MKVFARVGLFIVLLLAHLLVRAVIEAMSGSAGGFWWQTLNLLAILAWIAIAVMVPDRVLTRWMTVLGVVLIVPGSVSFFHYVLPQHDIAYISGTEIMRQDFSTWNHWFYAQADSGNVQGTTRDVRLINTVRERTWLFGLIRSGEQIMVYRNEDTGWIWPPYFKFDSSDLQAQAQSLVSAPGAPRWVVITHYGWRNRFLTIYPNATSIREIPDDRPAGERTTPPEYRIIPWFNIGFLVFLAICWGFLQIVWKQFRQRTVDPTVARVGETWDGIEAGVTTQQGRFRRWLDTWRRKR